MAGVVIDWWAVLVAALAVFFLGPIWYGPFLETSWMKAAGIDSARWSNSLLPGLLALSFVVEFAMAGTLAAILGNASSSGQGALEGFVIGLVFVTLPLVTHTLYEGRAFGNAFIHGGFWITALTLMGLLIGHYQTV